MLLMIFTTNSIITYLINSNQFVTMFMTTNLTDLILKVYIDFKHALHLNSATEFLLAHFDVQ